MKITLIVLLILTIGSTRILARHDQVQVHYEHNNPLSDSDQSVQSTQSIDEDLRKIEQERNLIQIMMTDQTNTEIVTNNTRAYLACEANQMVIKIHFSEPFQGVVYTNFDRSSNCQFFGNGGQYYELRIPLGSCGTKQEAPGVFYNNVIYRFHKSLELEEDEIKTIICRYPPASPPPVNQVPENPEESAPPVPIKVAPDDSEIGLLLIVLALLFLALPLLGIGLAQYCLKRRKVNTIRKKLPILPPKDIPKVFVSSMIEPIRIPRVKVPPIDYPSESDEDGCRTIVSETSSFRNENLKLQNTAFLPGPEITKQELVDTFLDTEGITEEDFYKTRQRRTTAKNFEKIPSLSSYSDPPAIRESIPDNDDRSHSEISDRPPTSLYVPQSLLDLRTKNLGEVFVNGQDETTVDEDVHRNRCLIVSAPRIIVKKIDDVYVTNILETVTTESITREKNLDDRFKVSRLLERREGLEEPEETRELNLKRLESSSVGTAGSSSTSRAFVDEIRSKNIEESISNTPEYERISSGHMASTKFADYEKTEIFAKESLKESLREGLMIRSRNSTPTKTINREAKLDMMLRILEEPPQVSRIDLLTASDRRKWRKILSIDQNFRSLIIESSTEDEYVRISRDIRYNMLFEAQTWEVIIKILTHSEVAKAWENVEKYSDSFYKRGRLSPVSSILPVKDSRSESAFQHSKLVLGYDSRDFRDENINLTAYHQEQWHETTGFQDRVDATQKRGFN